ncbi:hypothetical protein KSP40_PGU014650 [Platanthera guangdongensis]|uniref:Uncharacterized protein n=1 Tax=Platanthera guangdongensis TaxID=2320717 RepID=A0ABR2N553_9ASPA
MGRPEKEMRCRKHPSHKNINGVCPYCLRDRLANLSAGSSTANAASSTSASSSEYTSYESDSSSSFASPPPGRSRLLRLLKEAAGRNKKKALRGSKSFSLFSKEAEEKNMIKKGAGKILAKFGMVGAAGTRRRMQGEGGLTSGLTHSKTVKEKISSKWALIFS